MPYTIGDWDCIPWSVMFKTKVALYAPYLHGLLLKFCFTYPNQLLLMLANTSNSRSSRSFSQDAGERSGAWGEGPSNEAIALFVGFIDVAHKSENANIGQNHVIFHYYFANSWRLWSALASSLVADYWASSWRAEQLSGLRLEEEEQELTGQSWSIAL